MRAQGKFEIWVLPNNLRAASERAAGILREYDFKVLYLNVQRELNDLVEELALGAPYEQFINEVRRLGILRESISSWEYQLKPIFLALRGLKIRKPSMRIFCYRSSDSENSAIKRAEKIALLILRINSIGEVDVREWRKIIYGAISEGAAFADEEADYIVRAFFREGLKGEKAIIISDFSGRYLLRRLREIGVDVSIRYIFLPYYFTPLEVLMREAALMLSRGLDLSDEKIISLAKLHAEFIRDYVLTSYNYDEAYLRWLKDKVGMVRAALNSTASSSHIF